MLSDIPYKNIMDTGRKYDSLVKDYPELCKKLLKDKKRK